MVRNPARFRFGLNPAVRIAIHHRTSRTFSSQGRTPQRTPSHLRCAMSFAMSPGYTNTTLSRRARVWAKRRRVSRSQPTLSTGQSAPLLLAQALHKRAAARTWLPLRMIFTSDPGSRRRGCSFKRRSGSRPSPSEVLAHRSVRRASANEGPLPLRTSWGTRPSCRSASLRNACRSPARERRTPPRPTPRGVRFLHADAV